MKYFLVLNDGRYIDINENDLEGVLQKIEYNPFPADGGIMGFYLKGNKIYPVVDLNERMKIQRDEKKAYILCCGVVYAVDYRVISSKKPSSERVGLEEISREVLEELGVE